MLYLIAKTPTGKMGRDWHVNEKPPLGGEDAEVCEINADGHELDYIRRNCKGLQDCPDRAYMVWKGVLAQFIYDNLLQRTMKYTY